MVDEYGEGFPVAWCISNREDQLLLINFFKALRNKVGHLSPAWFMSDLAEQFYTAWIASFQNRPRKLVCTWHLDRAWRENLKQVTDTGLQAMVYHNLRVLLEETNKEKFEVLLNETIQQLSSSKATEQFAKYFITHYVATKEQWAACYRIDASVNTNMYVEAFHRVLKYVYMKGRVNKRLDKCLQVLLKIARDKGFERLVKIEKGKNTERINMIRIRHQASLKLSFSSVRATEHKDTWEVESSEGNMVYNVTQLHEQCPHSCMTRCTQCAVCVHMFSCDCCDALIKSSICKHVHLVARIQQSPNNVDLQMEMDVSEDVKTTIQQDSEVNDVSIVRKEVQTTLLSLAGQMNSIDDVIILKEIKSRILSAINFLKARKTIPFPNTKKSAYSFHDEG